MSPCILRIGLILIASLTVAPANPITIGEVTQKGNHYQTLSNVENPAGSSQTITSKTSSLLAEALQMIHNAKDASERKWLESFVHRLARLASDLEHDKQSGKVLKIIKTQEKAKMPSEENEVLVTGKNAIFIGSPKFPSSRTEERPGSFSTVLPAEYPDIKNTAHYIPLPAEKEDIFDVDLQVPEKSAVTPQGSVTLLQKQLPLRAAIDQTGTTTQSLIRVQLQRDDQSTIRQDLVKQIISKIRKLKDMGATNEEMMGILKRSEFTTDLPKTTAEFEEEEEGAAAGELEPDDLTDISTLAPSLGQIGKNDLSASQPLVAQKSDEDDLVKQLEEEKFILVSTDSTDSDEEALRRVDSSMSEEANYH